MAKRRQLLSDVLWIIVIIMPSKQDLLTSSVTSMTTVMLSTPTITQFPNVELLPNGTSVSLTCFVPIQIDPVIFWQDREVNLTELSNGSIWSAVGMIKPRYSLSSSRSVLTINPLMPTDNIEIYFRCRWLDQMTSQVSNFSTNHLVQVGYRPTNIYPPSQDIVAAVGDVVNLSFNISANPPANSTTCLYNDSTNILDSVPNFQFTTQNFGYDFTISVKFTLSSEMFYGRYVCSVSNGFGTGKVEFTVSSNFASDFSTTSASVSNLNSFNVNGLVVILAILLGLFFTTTLVLVIVLMRTRKPTKQPQASSVAVAQSEPIRPGNHEVRRSPQVPVNGEPSNEKYEDINELRMNPMFDQAPRPKNVQTKKKKVPTATLH